MRGNFFRGLGQQGRLLLSILLFGGYVLLVTVQPADDNDLNVVNLVLGYLGASGFCGEFYFGASKSGSK
ncbi:MAG: hypothetical protein CM15mV86_240 [uncultured marine virus]|nr:MAG: hypothetical protein CM15mV86_240 [uncultured marine virus]